MSVLNRIAYEVIVSIKELVIVDWLLAISYWLLAKGYLIIC